MEMFHRGLNIKLFVFLTMCM